MDGYLNSQLGILIYTPDYLSVYPWTNVFPPSIHFFAINGIMELPFTLWGRFSLISILADTCQEQLIFTSANTYIILLGIIAYIILLSNAKWFYLFIYYYYFILFFNFLMLGHWLAISTRIFPLLLGFLEFFNN